MDYCLDFIPVGNSNGDAVLLRYGDLSIPTLDTDVIDGGYLAVGEAIIEHLRHLYGTTRVANALLTHADDDHARGLVPVLERCTVGALYMNRPWLFAPNVVEQYHGNFTVQGLANRIRELHPVLVELESIAIHRGIPIFDAFQGVKFGRSIILAPSRERYISLIPDFDKTPTNYANKITNAFSGAFRAAKTVVDTGLEYWGTETLEEDPEPTSASNESSVVQLVCFDSFRTLLTGDAGPDALCEAADFAESIGLLQPPSLFQIPHQGSRRNVTPSILNRWLGPILPEGATSGWAACSVGGNRRSHPRKKVTNALRRRGYRSQLARTDGIHYYSPSLSRGAKQAPIVPFYNDVTEEDDTPA